MHLFKKHRKILYTGTYISEICSINIIRKILVLMYTHCHIFFISLIAALLKNTILYK